MDFVRICDGLFPLPVEEKVNMGTWRVLAIPFPPCLSRKRQSWKHGVRLRIPFSPCLSRKRQSWGACDSLFPLPVEEKNFHGTLQGSVAGVRTELRRALNGSAGLRGAS